MTANGPVRRKVVVANPQGLHLRPAAAFAKAAAAYRAAVVVWNGPKRADGKSAWDLLGLVAEAGAELVVEADGDDAAEAVGRLADLLGSAGDTT